MPTRYTAARWLAMLERCLACHQWNDAKTKKIVSGSSCTGVKGLAIIAVDIVLAP